MSSVPPQSEDTSIRTLGVTESVCPVCLRPVAAERVAEGDNIYLRKSCLAHGSFQTILWRGLASYERWAKTRVSSSHPKVSSPSTTLGCPFDCGLCAEHRQQTCCVVLEVTQLCNLQCPVCFASANSHGASDPALSEIASWCQTLMNNGGPFNIQLSGGEPTLRDDLPQVIELVRGLGFSFVQLNTNGIRLAQDRDYVRQLKAAGLGCVFLQFDGVSDDVYRAIRGRNLLQVKLEAIRNCAEFELGVVLVPTLVPGVNTAHIGEIISLAVSYTPTVRAVHFQPVSYFGRYPQPPSDADRITLPEVMQEIESQTAGQFLMKDFYPASGENAFCEFHGKFWIDSYGAVEAAARAATSCCAPPIDETLVQLSAKVEGNGEGARRAREFVARHWSMAQQNSIPDNDPAFDVSSFDKFLGSGRQSFCISGMAFQDAWNLDLARLRECFLHVLSPDQKIVPLCAYNLTGADGRTLYRISNPAHRGDGVS